MNARVAGRRPRALGIENVLSLGAKDGGLTAIEGIPDGLGDGESLCRGRCLRQGTSGAHDEGRRGPSGHRSGANTAGMGECLGHGS